MKDETTSDRKMDSRNHLRLGLLLAILCILPSVIWISLDHQPFGGDQSGYGTDSVRLYFALTQSSTEWFANMLESNPLRGPGIGLIGQFFVGFGFLIGSVNGALLILVVLTQVLSLYLIFMAVHEWSGGRFEIAASALLITGAAPLLVGFSHLFFVEPFQMLIVAWFIFILSRASRWSKPLVLGQLFLASVCGLMMKASTPLYVVVIGLVILAGVFQDWKNFRSWNWRERKIIATWGVGLLLLLFLGMWYWKNGSTVLGHTLRATASSDAVYWGKEDTFLNNLGYWFRETQRTFFPGLTFVTSVGLLTTGVFFWTRKQRKYRGPLDDYSRVSIILVVQIVVVLVFFSFGVIRLNRFLLPALPYLAVLISWAVLQIPSRAGVLVAAVVFGLQLFISHAFMFNMIQGRTTFFDLSKIGHLHRLNSDSANQKILDDIVSIACEDLGTESPLTVIAIDPALRGDWIAPVPAEYTAVKRFGLHPPCRFGYAGNNFWGASIEETWGGLITGEVEIVITTDPEIYPPPDNAANQALTIENHPRLVELLRTQDVFEERLPLANDAGILVFERVALISKGRALLDSGNMERGVEILETATEFEPENPEAWANLTLGYMLAGRQDDALAAGTRALVLNPEHFYVHLMMASIFQQQRDHQTALAHLTEAVRSAPSEQEEVRALRARAESLLATGEARQACLALAGAAAIDPLPEIAAEMSTLDCENLIGGD